MATALEHEDYPVRLIGLRSLTLDPEIQSRCKTDPAHARGITDFVLRNGPISEPIVVFDDGKELWPADGFHRIIGYREAARIQKRFHQIRAEIRPGTRREAIVFSAGANQEKTYLKRTPEDIERSVGLLLGDQEWRAESVAKIANHVGINPRLALKIIQRWHAVKGVPLPKSRLASNGREIPASKVTSKYKEGEIYTLKGKWGPGYFVRLSRKQHYLGSCRKGLDHAKLVLRKKLGAEFAPTEEPRFRGLGSVSSDSAKVAAYLDARFIPNRSVFVEDRGGFPGLYGRRGDDWVATWSGFETPTESTASVGRLVALQRYIVQSEFERLKFARLRMVVLCVPGDCSQQVLDLYLAEGIEFMTIEDFVISLKGTEQ